MILKSNKLVFIIKVLNLLIGSALKSIFWQYFNCVIYKEIYLILKSNKLVFIIKVLNLLIGFPNNKYTLNDKNYLKCLLTGGVLVLGGRDFTSCTRY